MVVAVLVSCIYIVEHVVCRDMASCQNQAQELLPATTGSFGPPCERGGVLLLGAVCRDGDATG